MFIFNPKLKYKKLSFIKLELKDLKYNCFSIPSLRFFTKYLIKKNYYSTHNIKTVIKYFDIEIHKNDGCISTIMQYIDECLLISKKWLYDYDYYLEKDVVTHSKTYYNFLGLYQKYIRINKYVNGKIDIPHDDKMVSNYIRYFKRDLITVIATIRCLKVKFAKEYTLDFLLTNTKNIIDIIKDYNYKDLEYIHLDISEYLKTIDDDIYKKVLVIFSKSIHLTLEYRKELLLSKGFTNVATTSPIRNFVINNRIIKQFILHFTNQVFDVKFLLTSKEFDKLTTALVSKL